MKKLIIIASILAMAFASTAMAADPWKLAWAPEPNKDGVMLFWKAVSDTGFVSLDVGNVDEYELTPLPLVQDTRYEFYVQFYTGDPKSFGGASDTIRWTFPAPPIVIELSGRPTQIIINQ